MPSEAEYRQQLRERVNAALYGGRVLVHVVSCRQMAEDVVAAVLAVHGSEGVFTGYGTSDAEAVADAWRDYRNRGAIGRVQRMLAIDLRQGGTTGPAGVVMTKQPKGDCGYDGH